MQQKHRDMTTNNLAIGSQVAAAIRFASRTDTTAVALLQTQIPPDSSGSLGCTKKTKADHIGSERNTYTIAGGLAPRLTESIKSWTNELHWQIQSGNQATRVPTARYTGHVGAAGFGVYKALLPHGSTFLAVPGMQSMTGSNLTSRLAPFLVRALETSADQPSFKAFGALRGQQRTIANSLLVTALEALANVPGLSDADAQVILRESVTQIVESAQQPIPAALPRPVEVQRPAIGSAPVDQPLPPLAVPEASGGVRLAEKVEAMGNRRKLNLAGVDLRRITDLDVQLVQLRKANPMLIVDMRGANLRGMNLQRAHLNGVILNEADLSSSNLSEADLSNADLNGAKLQANLAGANLRGARMHGANLSEANMSKADLRGARLTDATLNGADLGGSNLSGANLSGAYLPKSDLQIANLRGANLSGANLYRANLTGADLTGATLQGAHLTESIRPESFNNTEPVPTVALPTGAPVSPLVQIKSSAASSWLRMTGERRLTPQERHSIGELMGQYSVPPSLRTRANEVLLWTDVRNAAQAELFAYQTGDRFPPDLPNTDTGRAAFMSRVASASSYLEYLKKTPAAYTAIANQRLIPEWAYAGLKEGTNNAGVLGPDQLEAIASMPDSNGKQYIAGRAVEDISRELQTEWTAKEVPLTRATFGPAVKYLTSAEAAGTFGLSFSDGEPMRFKARVLDRIAEIENRLAANTPNRTGTAPYLAALDEVDQEIDSTLTGPYSNRQSDSLAVERVQAVVLFRALRGRIEASIPDRS